MQPFLLDGLNRFSVEILPLPNLTLKLQLHSLHCSFGFIPNSPFAQRDASEMFLKFVLVLHVSWKVYFRWEDRAFYWSIYDSCWQDQMSVRALRHDKRCGWFSNPGVCLQAFPSSLPHPLPAYSRHFSRGLCSETARKRLLRRLPDQITWQLVEYGLLSQMLFIIIIIIIFWLGTFMC